MALTGAQRKRLHRLRHKLGVERVITVGLVPSVVQALKAEGFVAPSDEGDTEKLAIGVERALEAWERHRLVSRLTRNVRPAYSIPPLTACAHAVEHVGHKRRDRDEPNRQ